MARCVLAGLLIAAFAVGSQGLLELPDTSGIENQVTAKLGVDGFFSLWLVFNDGEKVRVTDAPVTIFAPRNEASLKPAKYLAPDSVKKLLLDHIFFGEPLDLSNTTNFKTSLGRVVEVRKTKEGFRLNNATILSTEHVSSGCLLVVIDDFLFQDDVQVKENRSSSKLAIAEAYGSSKEGFRRKNNRATFIDNIMEVLSLLKSGVRVFQHFLSRSNVSRMLNEDEEYTVFVPTDHAFQRWHPIDWGFYPFSVPEFTESVIINHFVKGRLKQENIHDNQAIKTIGGQEIIFKKTPSLMVNGANVVKGDTPVTKGNIMFITEVLFVSESIVSKLHQQHRDKETPPLLAFPWFGAQFLSHAFLALERDKRFTQVTRFLNLADLAPHVSGTGYTFFVPVDKAFEDLGLNRMPDNYLSNGDGLQILLNHFVKGRLYDKDLKDGTELTTLGNKTIHVKRKKESVEINDATIVESEVFVYNLGTMFYIDRVLFTNINSLPVTSTETITTEDDYYTTSSEVESIPEELIDDPGLMPDVLVADAGVTDQVPTSLEPFDSKETPASLK